jgi:uncharacterized membrane protein YhiD involved in acid resistance
MLSQTEAIMLARVALAAALGLAIGWERRASGAGIKARTLALAALTAASLTALASNSSPPAPTASSRAS